MNSRPGVRPADSFRILDRQEVFRGKLVRVSVDHIVLPGGHETRHEVLHLPSAVCIVALLQDASGRLEVVLVEQFRNALEGYIHELPAGIVEEGEDPKDCAARELQEETGYRARRLEPIATLFPIPGTSAHRMYFYLAEGLEPGAQRLESSECLSVRRIPLDELVADILGSPPAGENAPAERPRIVDAKTYIGVLRVALMKNLVPVRESRSPNRP